MPTHTARAPRPDPTTVTGYADTDPRVRAWHLDPNCPQTWVAICAMSATTVARLAASFAAEDYSPCPGCAMAPLLDATAPDPASHGCYALACATISYHLPGCVTCEALTSYAAARELPLAMHAGRVALLLPGRPDNITSAAGLALQLGMAESNRPVPVVAGPLWEAASQLFYAGGHTLAATLDMASTLLGDPQRT